MLNKRDATEDLIMIAFLCEQYLGNRALIAAEKGIQEGRLLNRSQTHPQMDACPPLR